MTQDAKWADTREEFLELLLARKKDEAALMVTDAMGSGTSPLEFFQHCVNPVLEEVGKRFETLEIFLPEMVVAAEIVQHISDTIVTPYVLEHAGSGVEKHGKVLLASVKGDLHDIGKNMVGLMLRVNGFDVVDVGINVPPMEIISQAEQAGVDIIGMSSLLTNCLPYMQDVVTLLEDKGLRGKYKVIIGGAAPDREFSDEAGADGYGHSAAEAVTLCKNLMKQ